ncbi:MAG TPA: tRNA dimethylallyltransferase, partial [Candidatus Caenarcaniphilales bacterium]|nr:tRNA dimethylallyltransferase [Candidatus Caenarcaniphilales bacterium]
ERAEHRERIAERARGQFESGLLDEAARLRSRYPPTLRSFSAVRYREAFAVLDGTVAVDHAVARTITRTNQLARRQRTWFRAEPDIRWLYAGTSVVREALREVEQFLGR